MGCLASGDESAGMYPDGRWLYAMAFPIIRTDHSDEVRKGLRAAVQRDASVLHFYDLTPKRRIQVVQQVSELPWEAALVICGLTSSKRQERSRARILTHVLPRLELMEKVSNVMLESRGRADRRDVDTRDGLRGSRSISQGFSLEHVSKVDDELVWLADLVVGAFMTRERRGIGESWEILENARPLEVTWLPREGGR